MAQAPWMLCLKWGLQLVDCSLRALERQHFDDAVDVAFVLAASVAAAAAADVPPVVVALRPPALQHEDGGLHRVWDQEHRGALEVAMAAEAAATMSLLMAVLFAFHLSDNHAKKPMSFSSLDSFPCVHCYGRCGCAEHHHVMWHWFVPDHVKIAPCDSTSSEFRPDLFVDYACRYCGSHHRRQLRKLRCYQHLQTLFLPLPQMQQLQNEVSESRGPLSVPASWKHQPFHCRQQSFGACLQLAAKPRLRLQPRPSVQPCEMPCDVGLLAAMHHAQP